MCHRPSKTKPNVLFKGSGAVKHVNWQSFAKAVDGGQTTKFFPKQNWSLYRKSLSDGPHCYFRIFKCKSIITF